MDDGRMALFVGQQERDWAEALVRVDGDIASILGERVGLLQEVERQAEPADPNCVSCHAGDSAVRVRPELGVDPRLAEEPIDEPHPEQQEPVLQSKRCLSELLLRRDAKRERTLPVAVPDDEVIRLVVAERDGSHSSVRADYPALFAACQATDRDAFNAGAAVATGRRRPEPSRTGG